MKGFDAHTHFFGREFFEFQAGLVPGTDKDELLRRIESGGIEIPPADASAHAARWLRELDGAGVARAVVFASVPAETGVVAQVARESGERFIPWAVVNPRATVTLDAVERACAETPIRGLLLFPAMHDYAITDAIVHPVLDLAAHHRMVVFVHCGLLTVGVRRFIGLDPDFGLQHGHPRDMTAVAASRPELQFVVPHFGAGFFEEVLELGSACENVYVDTAGSNSWVAQHSPPLSLSHVFARAREVLGARRILYGSDSGIFPRGYRRDVLDAQIRAMKDAGFSDSERDGVLGENVATLLGL